MTLFGFHCTIKCLLHYYSSGNKFDIFCFAQFIPQILDIFQNQGQLWNLLVLTISKYPLHVQFDQVLGEIFEVKEEWSDSLIFMMGGRGVNKWTRIQKLFSIIGFSLEFFPQLISTNRSWDSPPAYLVAMVTMWPVGLMKSTRKQKLLTIIGFFLEFFSLLILTYGRV